MISRDIKKIIPLKYLNKNINLGCYFWIKESKGPFKGSYRLCIVNTYKMSPKRTCMVLYLIPTSTID